MKGRPIKRALIVIAVILIGYSCKSIRIKSETEKDFTIETIIDNYQPNLGDFKSFSVPRLSISLINNNSQNSLRGNLRMVRDSAILISLNAGLGIELARGFLTIENVQIIDRVNSEYSEIDYSQIQKMIGIDADYEMVESLLLNSFNISNLLSNNDNLISFDNEHIIVYDRRSLLISGFDEARVFFRKSDFIVKKIDLFDNQSKHFAFIEYSDFSTHDQGILLPQQIKIFVNRSGETTELTINFLKSEINTVKDISFSVPSRYR